MNTETNCWFRLFKRFYIFKGGVKKMIHRKQLKKIYQLNRYLKKIRNSVPNIYIKRKIVINDMKQSIRNYLSEFPNASFEDIQQEFGTPLEIAAAFLNELPDTYAAKTIIQKKHYLIVFALLSAVIISCLLMWIIYLRRNTVIYIENTVYFLKKQLWMNKFRGRLSENSSLDEWKHTL